MRTNIPTTALACAGSLISICPVAIAQGFFEDSHANLSLRNYYFNDDYRDGGNDRREWAQGFLLNSQAIPGARSASEWMCWDCRASSLIQHPDMLAQAYCRCMMMAMQLMSFQVWG